MRYNLCMRILGIETSCDETAVCLIEAEGAFGPDFHFKILGNALSSQAAIHAQFGGVFPNLAKNEHSKNLVPMLTQTLDEAHALEKGLTMSFSGHRKSLEEILAREPELYEKLEEFLQKYERPNIDCIAVTAGPGLAPALWVGVNFAKALSLIWDTPIIAVDHMEGHIVMSMMKDGALAHFEFPVLSLLVSGGHTEFVLSEKFGRYKLVGRTRDDAAGEAFDKVARMLGLPYPGGPHISRLAAKARTSSEVTPHWMKLPRPMLHEDNFDFSFSGLKTAVLRIVEANTPLADEMKTVIAREFEDAVADVLVGKTLRAVDTYGANAVIMGGGVSANTHIRHRLAETLAEEGNIAKLLVCPPEFSTDNALMIALPGYFDALKKEFADPTTLVANADLSLGDRT
ncbi:tRNA (adenosine(37)-N6)-threonylcarbamoyltransferase complex transferase subunit TsaD [Candidatus Kaiserbacteria bacterium]|nr:tRNA (adenosine(37)-N6)-threonylcarbamoyltransferase complex transferase subunit TsaD [Candidatus Kaiserbacteria bacterium]